MRFIHCRRMKKCRDGSGWKWPSVARSWSPTKELRPDFTEAEGKVPKPQQLRERDGAISKQLIRRRWHEQDPGQRRWKGSTQEGIHMWSEAGFCRPRIQGPSHPWRLHFNLRSWKTAHSRNPHVLRQKYVPAAMASGVANYQSQYKITLEVEIIPTNSDWFSKV